MNLRRTQRSEAVFPAVEEEVIDRLSGVDGEKESIVGTGLSENFPLKAHDSKVAQVARFRQQQSGMTMEGVPRKSPFPQEEESGNRVKGSERLRFCEGTLQAAFTLLNGGNGGGR